MTDLALEQRKIIALITPLYEEIRDIEESLGFRLGGGDMRARVEFFHDAVRALSSGVKIHHKNSRLAIEKLTYDLMAIRYIESKPFAPLGGEPMGLSASTSILNKKANSLTSERNATREDKKNLSDFYMRYGILFAALFRPLADRDALERIEEIEEEMENILDAKDELQLFAQGMGSKSNLAPIANTLNDKKLGTLIAKITGKNNPTPEMIENALKEVKAKIKEEREKKEMIAQNHMNFLTAQLGIYETGKIVVKQLAVDGLNLAGRFVANAASAEKGIGKNR